MSEEEHFYYLEDSGLFAPNMPMASAVTFSENYISPVGLSDFQNANYPNSPVYQSAHIPPTEQDGIRRISSDISIGNPTEPYRGAALQETHNPYLTITEQPKSKWRYRYQSEKGSHGGLPGCSSTPDRRTFPTVKLVNFSGSQTVYVRASLWTNDANPAMHVHKLCGQRCEQDGTYIIKLNEDRTAVFQDVTILFVAKKEVSAILFKRKLEKYDMSCILDVEKKQLKDEAEKEAKNMNLNSVRLCFEAFYYVAGTKKCTLLCPRVFSDPVANQKSPDAGDLKICRMSRIAGSVVGGDDVFLLVSKVNKKDISVRFYECDSDWEDLGKFTEADVHYQYAIVFQTPPYHKTDIKNPVTVLLQLQRKNGEVSEAKEYTYIPYDPDNEGIGKKRKKNNPYQEFDGSGSGPYGTFGVPDYNPCGNIQTSVDNESMNGSSLGSSSSCIGHNESVESYLMESDDMLKFEDYLFSENSSENSYLEDNAVLIKPHEDPLLSEANVPRAKWIVPDSQSSSMQVESASSYIKTDSVSVEETEKHKIAAAGLVIKCTEEIQHAFSRLAISEERSAKKSNMNSSTCFVNPGHPVKKGTEATARKDGHSDNTEENIPFEKGASKAIFSSSLTKRIWNSLSLAVTNGYSFVILRQLQHLINFSNKDGDTLLHLAVIYQWNNLNFIEDLLKVSEDVSCSPLNLTNKERQTPLHLAVVMRKHSLVKLLVQYGADPTYPDKNGCSSIHLAVKNSTDCLREILNHWNYKSSQQILHLEYFNHHGLAPLHCAVSGGFIECIILLCDSRADVNVRSKKDGRTPLHFATDKDIAVMRLLLAQKDINVNAQDYGGNTALHLACAMKRHDIVKELMLRDANPLIENFEGSDSDPDCFSHAGKTPYDFANENEEIIKILAGLEDRACETFSDFGSRSVKSISLQPALPSCRPKEPPRSTNCTTRKTGPELDKEHCTTQGDSGYISGSISVLNDETMQQLCELLDPPSSSWKDLIMFTGVDEVIQKNILKLAPYSPTKAIIELFLRDGGDIETLFGALGAANLIEAQDVVKRYLDSKN